MVGCSRRGSSAARCQHGPKASGIQQSARLQQRHSRCVELMVTAGDPLWQLLPPAVLFGWDLGHGRFIC
jgi:hypothetical protein